MCHFDALSRLGVTGILELLGVRLVLVGKVIEFKLNLAIGASEVRLPAIVEVLLAQDADLVAGEALLLGVFSCRSMSVASRGHSLDGLLESPCDLLESPEVNGLRLVVTAHETVKSQTDSVGSGRVNDVVVVGAGLDVGRRKDADRVVRDFVLGKRSLNGDSSLESHRCDGATG